MTQSAVSKRTLLAGVAALLAVGVGFLALPASAQTVEVPFQDLFATGAEGSVVSIGRADVSGDLVGRTCNLVAEVKNQSSVHPGNTLVITSGDSVVEIPAIEDTADGLTTQAGTLTLSSEVVVSVKFGPDQYTSLGSSLTVTCDPLPPSPPPTTVPADPPYSG